MNRPRVTSFTPKSTSRVLKFAIAGCTGALIKAEGLEEVIDGAA
jgi:hypothetical protein